MMSPFLLRPVAICFVSLMTLMVCTTVSAQRLPGDGHGPVASTFAPPFVLLYAHLSTTPTVQKELNLTSEQKVKIKEITDKLQNTVRASIADIRERGKEDHETNMEDEMDKKMHTLAEETKKALEETLLPGQLKRLNGIALQVVGVLALTDKEVQQDLKLSDSQAAKIRAASIELMSRSRTLLSEGTTGQAVGSKMQELHSDYEQQVLDVLTADQRVLLNKMKGVRLEIPPAELKPLGAPARPTQKD